MSCGIKMKFLLPYQSIFRKFPYYPRRITLGHQAVRGQSTEGVDLSQESTKGVSLAYASFESTIKESPLPPIIINHGLFGSKTNWKSVSKSLVKKTGAKVYTLDARNHGDSPHTDEMNYLAMASDLEMFFTTQGIDRAIVLGHSMGGRAAMTFALTRPHLVEKLIIVDVAPGTFPQVLTSDIPDYITAMKESLTHLTDDMAMPVARTTADRILEGTVKDYAIRQFILTNLRKGESCYEWQVNIYSIEKHVVDIMHMPELDKTYSEDVLFICGEYSTYVKKDDHPRIRKYFPKAEIVDIPGAGHWVHAEKPNEFINCVIRFITTDQNR